MLRNLFTASVGSRLTGGQEGDEGYIRPVRHEPRRADQRGGARGRAQRSRRAGHQEGVRADDRLSGQEGCVSFTVTLQSSLTSLTNCFSLNIV